MLVGRYGSRLVHRLARIFQRDDHFLIHRVRGDVLDARLALGRAVGERDGRRDGDVHHALRHFLVKRRLDLFLRLALELALRGVRVVPVFQRRLLRQHDANPYGSAHGDNGHQRGEYMLGHAEDLAGILGGVGSYVGNGMRSV